MTRRYLHANPAMTILPALLFGLVLGMRHATDADHIAAVSTIVATDRTTRGAALIGAMWGVGHSVSVMLVGGALVLFRLTMPPRVALGLELGVAVMLVVLGIRALVWRTRSVQVRSLRRPMLIGVVHGLAGSAVLALLVIGATPSAVVASVYLVCFCAGTVMGMGAITALLAA